MKTRLPSVLRNTSPAARGALYYLGYWGVFGVYDPLIFVYFYQLGLSGSQIGVLAGLVPLMTVLIALPISSLADRQALRVTLLAGSLTGMAAVLLVFGLPKQWLAILPVAVALSVFRAPTGAIGDSLVVRMAVRHGLDYGRLRLWGSLGFATTAILFGWIWGKAGMHWMFAGAAMLLVPLVFVALTLEEGPRVARKAQRPLREIFGDHGLLILLLSAYLAHGGMLVSSFFSGIYLISLGGTTVTVGALFAILALAEIPSMRSAVPLMARIGGPRTLVLAYGLSATAHFGYAAAPTPAIFLACAALRGLGYGFFFVAIVRSLDVRVPQEWASSVQALFYAGAFGLAPLLASVAGGMLYDQRGGTAVFFAAGLLIVVAGVLLAVTGAAGLLRTPALSGETAPS